MKYWKAIALENADQIQEQLKSWAVESGLASSKFFWNELSLLQVDRASPLLRPALSKLGFSLRAAALIVARQNGRQIHIDDVPLNSCRINIPIMNTKGTLTAFYKTKVEPVKSSNKATATYDRTDVSKRIKLTTQNFYWHIEPKDAKMVGALELKGPTILRVGAPHAVLGATDVNPRVTITLLVSPDPGYLLDESEDRQS